MPWSWRYRQLGAAMWVLGIEPVSPGRAAGDTSLQPHASLSLRCLCYVALVGLEFVMCDFPVFVPSPTLLGPVPGYRPVPPHLA